MPLMWEAKSINDPNVCFRSPAALCDPRQRPERSHAGKPNGFALWTRRIGAINKCKINRQLSATVKNVRFRSRFVSVFQSHLTFLSHFSTAAADSFPWSRSFA